MFQPWTILIEEVHIFIVIIPLVLTDVDGAAPGFLQAMPQSSGFNVKGFTNFSKSSREHGLHSVKCVNRVWLKFNQGINYTRTCIIQFVLLITKVTRNADFNGVARLVAVEDSHSERIAEGATTTSSIVWRHSVELEENGRWVGRHAVQRAERTHQVRDLRVVRRIERRACASSGQHLLFRHAVLVESVMAHTGGT